MLILLHLMLPHFCLINWSLFAMEPLIAEPKGVASNLAARSSRVAFVYIYLSQSIRVTLIVQLSSVLAQYTPMLVHVYLSRLHNTCARMRPK